jgi:isopentenyl-diphosphate delta-isomerase
MVDVVLVDKHGDKVGLLEKYAAHRNPGFLHKAISVVLYRKSVDGVEVLLQKRSDKKPLWPLYWADTCSTHQLDGESDEACAVRRLQFEMGITIEEAKLKTLYAYQYRVDYNDTLSEHELNSVVVGEYTGDYVLNMDEVKEAKWVKWDELTQAITIHPEQYAPWFVLIFKDKRFTNYIKAI